MDGRRKGQVRIGRDVVLGLLAFLVVSCAGEPPPSGRRPANVVLDPASITLGVGARIRLDARALDRNGTILPEARFSFASSNPEVASVDRLGWVRALRPGEAEVVARTEGAEARARIRVRPRVDAISIRPAAPTLLEGESLQLEFDLLDAEGLPFEAELEVRWSSDDPTVARVDDQGILAGIAPGETRVRVAAGEGEGATTVRVRPRAHAIETWAAATELVVGESILVHARVRDRRGVEIQRPLAWSVDDLEVARVDPDGRVHALGPGATLVRAQADGAEGVFAIRVLPKVARLEIVPAHTRIYAGVTSPWSVRAFDADGNLLEGRTIHWSSTDPEVARVDGLGRVEGRAEGFATISARADEARAEAEIEVLQPAEIVVEAAPPPRLEPGSTAPVRVAFVGPRTLPAEWSTSDPSVAVVEDGAVRVLDLGRATLAVESGGLRHTFLIFGSLRFSSIAAGGDFACGVSDRATVWCWGGNARGQLGDGTTVASHLPVRVQLDPGLAYREVTAGLEHACALSEEGLAFCWGANRSGELGPDLEAPFSATPIAVLPEERFLQLSAGAPPTLAPVSGEGGHTCGLTEAGTALCWGNGRVGQLGIGETPHASGPVSPAGDVAFVELHASAGYTCGIDADAVVHCWGLGPLGTPDDPFGPYRMSSLVPRVALFWPPDRPEYPPVPERFASLALGEKHACGITDERIAYCWGDRPFTGPSGYFASEYDGVVSVQFAPLNSGTWSSLAPGSSSSCGIDEAGTLECWGREISKGDPAHSCTLPIVYRPTPVLEGVPVRAVTVGRRPCEDFACVLDAEGMALCWGRNTAGQTGQPPSKLVPQPTPLFPDGPDES